MRSSNVGIGKAKFGIGLSWNEPLLLDPEFQHLRFNARRGQKCMLAHDHDELPSRGLNSLPLIQFDTNALSSGSGDFGKTIFSFTSSSPLPRPRRGAPFPFKRRVVPVFDPFGTDIVTSPTGVGTRIRPPSTASESEIGNSNNISSPSRVNRLSARTSTSMSASPGPPLPAPGAPLPFKRRTCPSIRPGGIFTSSVPPSG